MNKWDVVLVGYPFSSLLVTKIRPAVIVSPDAYHQKGEDILVILVTSNTSRQSPHDIIVTTAHPEFKQTGLRKDSAIRVSKIMTLEKSKVQHVLGKLGASLSAEVERELRAFLELPPYQPPLGQR
ncbi:MAG: type II toxin-antitoxin system PemK/MazF family toxin [Verrucomicrobiota bacterium]|jgi:mRNA interferase MazF